MNRVDSELVANMHTLKGNEKKKKRRDISTHEKALRKRIISIEEEKTKRKTNENMNENHATLFFFVRSFVLAGTFFFSSFSRQQKTQNRWIYSWNEKFMCISNKHRVFLSLLARSYFFLISITISFYIFLAIFVFVRLLFVSFVFPLIFMWHLFSHFSSFAFPYILFWYRFSHWCENCVKNMITIWKRMWSMQFSQKKIVKKEQKKNDFSTQKSLQRSNSARFSRGWWQ